MTGLAMAVVLSILAVQALEWAADMLNLRSLKPSPPPGFEDVYDPARYARAQEYTRVRTRFGFVSQAVGLVALFIFWGVGGFNLADRWVAGLGLPILVQGLLYVGALALAQSLLGLPFAVYSTFVIEARFGFNRTTAKTFIFDRLKGLLLSVVIGAPLLLLVLWIFDRLGPSAWVWGWAATTAVSLMLQFVAPTWIMPLFNKFTPLPAGELRDEIFALAKRLQFPLVNVFLMDGSKRSAKGNAFFTGFGKTKRIALFDTLVAKQSTPEMVAVLAHEIGHYKEGHIWKGFLLGTLQTGGMFFLLALAVRWPALFAAFGLERVSVHAGLVVFGILFTPVSFLLSLPLRAYSRRNEYEADRYAREKLGTGRELSTALRKLSSDSLSNLTPHPLYVKLHYTHPPLMERVSALR